MKNTAKSSTAPMVPEVLPPEAAGWSRCRELCQHIRNAAETVVDLGVCLKALKREWYASGVGGGGDRMSKAYKDHLKTGVSRGGPSPNLQALTQNGTLLTRHQVVGWQKKVEAELGMSWKTAERIIERSDSIILMRQVKQGEAVKYLDAKNVLRELKPSPDLQKLAESALIEVEAGTISAPRAWAGLVGEGTRLQQSGELDHRNEVDHAKNLKAGLVKLTTSLPHWDDLRHAELEELETVWFDEVLPLIPARLLNLRQRK